MSETTIRPAGLPGWYPDPRGAPGQRYWDGQHWTHYVPSQANPYAAPPFPQPPMGPRPSDMHGNRNPFARSGNKTALIIGLAVAAAAVVIGIVIIAALATSGHSASYQKGYESGTNGVARQMYSQGLYPSNACKTALSVAYMYQFVGHAGRLVVHDDLRLETLGLDLGGEVLGDVGGDLADPLGSLDQYLDRGGSLRQRDLVGFAEPVPLAPTPRTRR